MLVHDGYQYFDQAIAYLQNRGFPEDTEVLLLPVSDLFRTPLHLVGKDIAQPVPGYAARRHSWPKHKKTQLFFDKLEAIKRQAQAKLQSAFPDWNIRFERPFSWQPNLVILGAFDQSSTSNPGLGEVIRKLSTESDIPLIVARPQSRDAATRRPLLIAFDGPASAAAILNNLSRDPTASEVHLMFYKDPLMTHAARWSAGYEEPDREWIDSQMVKTKSAVEALGHKVICSSVVGHTAAAILAEARRIGAETILLGTGPMAGLGLSAESLAATIAIQANCSVEIVFSEQKPRPTATLRAFAAPQNIPAWQGGDDARAGVASPAY